MPHEPGLLPGLRAARQATMGGVLPLHGGRELQLHPTGGAAAAANGAGETAPRCRGGVRREDERNGEAHAEEAPLISTEVEDYFIKAMQAPAENKRELWTRTIRRVAEQDADVAYETRRAAADADSTEAEDYLSESLTPENLIPLP